MLLFKPQFTDLYAYTKTIPHL